MSDDIMAAVCQKNRAKHVAEKIADTIDFSIYKRMKSSLKSMIQSAKLTYTYLHELLQKSHKFSHMAAQLCFQVNAVIRKWTVYYCTIVSSFGGNFSGMPSGPVALLTSNFRN